MPKIDPAACPTIAGSDYPPPLDGPCRGRRVARIGQGGGLTDFGASLVTVAPGAWSSQRHWHEANDELVVMLAGELVLVEDGTRTPMRPGDIAVFRKDVPDGHHLVNESAAEASFLAIGANKGGTTYSDADLLQRAGETGYRRRNGTPY